MCCSVTQLKLRRSLGMIAGSLMEMTAEFSCFMLSQQGTGSYAEQIWSRWRKLTVRPSDMRAGHNSQSPKDKVSIHCSIMTWKSNHVYMLLHTCCSHFFRSQHMAEIAAMLSLPPPIVRDASIGSCLSLPLFPSRVSHIV